MGESVGRCGDAVAEAVVFRWRGGIFGVVVHGVGFAWRGSHLFVILVHLVFFWVRLRRPEMGWTILVEVAVGLVLGSPVSLLFSLFQGLYLGWFLVVPLVFYPLFSELPSFLGVGFSGLFLHFWERERLERTVQRDWLAGQNFGLEVLRDELATSMSEVERQAIVSERARISRDLHDHAGYEMVAAYMSLQTVRTLLETEDSDVLALYDEALLRLDKGAKTMREAVHDLSTVSSLGVERLREMCQNPMMEFRAYGDMLQISGSIWHVLETCLKECLTNAKRHARASKIVVDLQATDYLVRLSVENDGAATGSKSGIGLRNLTFRVRSLGGHLTASQSGENFTVVCVIPLREVKK